MSRDWYQDILDFHREAKHHIEPFPRIPPDTVQRLRRKLIREEVGELLDGIDDNDLAKIADGGADSVVVILGTMVSYGIDLRPIWDEVHKTNMKKLGGGRRADGKSLKPKGWQPPKVEELLNEQRRSS
jgi:predicted HAD superfamily Cof-like phosphohydrolase